MASRGSPYNRGEPIRMRCVGLRTSSRTVSFKKEEGVIKPEKTRVTTLAALWDGKKTYISPQNSENSLFNENITYFVQNYTLSKKYGKDCLLVDHKSSAFKTALIPLSEEERAAAMEVLLPSSVEKTGEEHNLFMCGGYVTLRGQVNNVKVIRMTQSEMGEIPVLDLDLKCGGSVLNVTLWRDEALTPMCLDDEVIITHLRPSTSNGVNKLNSSAYTSVKIVEQKPTEEDIEVIGISENEDGLCFLTKDFKEFITTPDVYKLSVDEMLEMLPVKLHVVHLKRRISKIEHPPEMEE